LQVFYNYRQRLMV